MTVIAIWAIRAGTSPAPTSSPDFVTALLDRRMELTHEFASHILKLSSKALVLWPCMLEVFRGEIMLRGLILCFLLMLLAVLPPARHAQDEKAGDEFNKSVQPFFSKNCYLCHNSELKSGNLNLEAYKTADAIKQDGNRLDRVLQKLSAGEMPPKGMPRPDETELKTIIRWLESETKRANAPTAPDPGRVTARRLNRTEYNNTVRDLLGVDLRPADDFPQDDSGYGFDNIGDVLSLSPALMEKYIASAEKIARAAVFGPEQMKPTLVRPKAIWRMIKPSPVPLKDYDLTGLSLPNSTHVIYRFPTDGEYVIRAMMGGERPRASEAIQVILWVDGHEVQTLDLDIEGGGSFSDDRQEFYGWTREFRAKLTAGEHWIAVSIPRLYEGLPPEYGGPNPSKRPKPPPPVFKPPRDATPERIEELRKKFEERLATPAPANAVRINSLEIGGPYQQAKTPSVESLKRIYVCGHLDGHHQPGCARKIIASLAHRAYRRPVTEEEIDQLVKLCALAREQGDSFEEGICLSIQAMLVSPHFLFRIERDRGDQKRGDQKRGDQKAQAAEPVSQHELASRLSYFLWSTMPDDQLLGLADQGTLSNPRVLAAEVRRMLKDPKSRALVENFGGQWLELRKLESVKPDKNRFPEFDEYLRISMRRETELFFDYIVHEDRSILDFIDANYTFINEPLAALYNIPDIKGPEFRKVTLASDTGRGGILTQPAILTVSSYATRTSPVLRGKWILGNLLNAPPPPPPPDVPNLNEAAVGSSASLRQQLEEHRKNATCASCHSRMDPLGFGLENFNAIGAWRTMDGKFPIDSSGVLPDGRKFQGPQELKAILKADRDGFTEGLTEKLLTYALGRGLEPYDKPAVKEIAGRVAADDYRFSSLVLEIVKSLPFQMRRGNQSP